MPPPLAALGRLQARLLVHRQVLISWLPRLGISASGIAVALAILQPTRRYFFLIYTAPLLLTGPLWLRARVAELDSHSERELWVDLGVFLVAALRMFGGWGVLPYSGHMLFLTYSGLTTRSIGYRSLAVALLVMTSIYKLAVWHDWSTWLWGIGLGMAAAGIRVAVSRVPAVH